MKRPNNLSSWMRPRAAKTLGDFGQNYSDYWWFVSEVGKAKDMAAKTGNVDGAKKLIDDALKAWQSGPYGLPSDAEQAQYCGGKCQSPPDFATNAKNYCETFRQGSAQLQTASTSATGAQQAYYASPEQQKLAQQQIAAEKTSLQVASGPASFMYEVAPVLASPTTAFNTEASPVEAATGAPKGSEIEKATQTVTDVVKSVGIHWEWYAAGAGGLVALYLAYKFLYHPKV